MRSKLSKLSIIGGFCALFILFGLNGSPVDAFSSGPPTSRTGAPALGSFPAEPTCTACHTSFALNSGPGTLAITGLPTNYSPNQEVTVTVTITQTQRALFGFESTVLDDQGQKAGDLVITDAARTQLRSGTGNFAARQYIEHTSAGTAPNGTDQNSWTFKWKAPAQSMGRVTFYVAGNAANGNGSNQGDFIYNVNASVQPATTVANFDSVSAASFARGSLTANAIVAGFGGNLSQNVVPATTVPLPTNLDGTMVGVRDSNNVERDAGLYIVTPSQVNYLIPADTANGAAIITVRRNGTPVAQGTATIDTISPSLFSANSTGSGVAAGYILRRRIVNNMTVDTNEPIVRLNPTTGQIEPIMIDLGPDGDIVFLIIYGTGFRAVTPQSAPSATIGGMSGVQVLFAGPSPDFLGLDQANFTVPRSLIGRGLVDVAFMVEGKPANTVQIGFK